MNDSSRYRAATMVAGLHSLCSLSVALVAACIVFGIWYSYPYGELAGGRELFLLIVTVDVLCGPLLTFVLFNPRKSRNELLLDLSLVAIVQIAALIYGMWAVWEARPLYLVHEVDRFKVISRPDVDATELQALPEKIKPQFWSGPQIVGVRSPKNAEEYNKVLFEAVQGGRDYAERPNFYIPYENTAALKALERARPLARFLEKHPLQQGPAQRLAHNKGVDFEKLLYLPVIGRQNWIVVLSPMGQIEGFLPGDGF